VGNERHADWQQITRDAKKLNERIEAAFYNFFRDRRPDAGRGSLDGYDAAQDSVAADPEGLTKQDIAAAQDTYARCFRRAQGGKPADMPDENRHEMPGSEGDPR
jgi:2,4-dienoyl-CoA reductase-like NADH-dependent reductase (Old Yellow Enzyme family)